MNDAATDTDDLAQLQHHQSCCICLEAVDARGRTPLYAPGCCGAWIHLECAYAIEVDGAGGKCPLCRAPAELPRRPPPPPLFHCVSTPSRASMDVMVRQLMMPAARFATPGYDGAIVLPPRPAAEDYYEDIVRRGGTWQEEEEEDTEDDDESAAAPADAAVVAPMFDANELDIALVMDQAHCSRDAAMEAINTHRGDLVDAIMALTHPPPSPLPPVIITRYVVMPRRAPVDSEEEEESSAPLPRIGSID